MWPNESEEYRAHREKLVRAEASLRANAEEVAQLRRGLPAGGEPREDYIFREVDSGNSVRLSQLFDDGHDSLLVYSFMYAPGGKACPMCSSLLDSLDGAAPQISRRISLAVAAKADAGTLAAFARKRGWRNLRLLSSGENTYNAEYGAENATGEQMPIMHVWIRRNGKVRHFWASELLYHDDPAWQGQPRHADMIWPLWNVFDLVPEGRGTDWYPKV